MAEGVKWTGPQVRKTFLNFFEERGHTVGMSVCLSLPLLLFFVWLRITTTFPFVL